jgi:nucleoside-diphosphate-sugar epimerase
MLGATGKLGSMLRAIWREDPDAPLVYPISRRDVSGMFQWQPDQTIPDLPNVDSVLSLWAIRHGSRDEMAENAALGLAAVRLAEALGASQVLHFSSSAVYGQATGPLRESSPTHPVNHYGTAKLAMERAVLAYPTEVRSVLMRIGNVAGAESLFGSLRSNADIVVDRFPDGQGPRRTYIAPHDLARIVMALMARNDLSGPINVAAPVPTDMYDIAKAYREDVHWSAAPEGALQDVVLDTTMLSEVLRLNPVTAQPKHLIASARATGCWP